MASVVNYGPKPQPSICPYCQANITTKIVYETSMKTHLAALLLCVFGCCLCMCIPYCLNICKNKDHYCPLCDTYLGTYKSF